MLDIPTQYCESLVGYFLSQPLNAISSLAYVISAFFAYRYLLNHRFSRLYILPILLIVVAVGSIWWHVAESSLGDVLDTLGIVAFASVVTILLLGRITKSKMIVFLSFVTIVSLVLLSERLNALNGSLPYIALLFGFIVIGGIYVKQFPLTKSIFFSTLLIFLVAITLRSVDMILCSFMPFGTHFLWHILVAVFGYKIILLLAHSESKS